MILTEQTAKGLAQCLVDQRLEGEPLHLHITELAAGLRSHPPHRHPGVEAFYILDGEVTLELDEERRLLHAGEAVIFDSDRLHGLINTSAGPARYLVIIRP